jgi:hypothetical protein
MRAKATAASKNRHLKTQPLAETITVFHPQQGISVPSAAVMAGPVGFDVE